MDPKWRHEDGVAPQPSVPVREAARDAIETIIGFWKRPSTHDRLYAVRSLQPQSRNLLHEPDYNFGPNIGYGLGTSYGFGANINAETDAYMAAQREMFAAEIKAQSSTQQAPPKPPKFRAPRSSIEDLGHTRKNWDSYHDVCREVAILHGARNKYTIPVQPVDAEDGAESGQATGDNAPRKSASGAYISLRDAQMSVPATKTKTASFKTASSAASDKIQ